MDNRWRQCTSLDWIKVLGRNSQVTNYNGCLMKAGGCSGQNITTTTKMRILVQEHQCIIIGFIIYQFLFCFIFLTLSMINGVYIHSRKAENISETEVKRNE